MSLYEQMSMFPKDAENHAMDFIEFNGERIPVHKTTNPNIIPVIQVGDTVMYEPNPSTRVRFEAQEDSGVDLPKNKAIFAGVEHDCYAIRGKVKITLREYDGLEVEWDGAAWTSWFDGDNGYCCMLIYSGHNERVPEILKGRLGDVMSPPENTVFSFIPAASR